MLVQIVPRLPPSVDGVGDFGLTLARALKTSHRIETSFVCGFPKWQGPASIEDYSVTTPSSPTAYALAELLEREAPGKSTVWLNYVGYGYSRNGCPLWLADGLGLWRRRVAGRRLITMFHELHAFGPPWTRAFWLNPWQRAVVNRLAKNSDIIRTNIRRFARYLEKRTAHPRDVICQPIFSNVGEPVAISDYHDREPWLVVFGSQQWRTKAFRENHADLDQLCRRMGIEKILDIGVPIDFSHKTSVPVVATGLLPAKQVSAWLSKARAGFVAYWPHALGKSGIFAAYAAHGVIPILPSGQSDGEETAIEPNKHYYTADAIDLSRPEQLTIFARALFRWYRGHDSAKVASACARLMSQSDSN